MPASTGQLAADAMLGAEQGAHLEAQADRYTDDEAAVRRVLAGEVDAFEQIVVRWQGPRVNLAYRFCRDPGVAEEMAQEAFLKVFRGLGKFRQEARFSTWLFSVATNHYRSVMRRRYPPTTPVDEVAYGLVGGDLDREVDSGLRDEAVRRAVAALPPKYRDVVVLYYFHEMDLAETARSAKLPPGTVKARLFRARALLEQKLAGLLHAPSPLADEA